MANQITSNAYSFETCRPLYYATQMLNGGMKALLQVSSLLRGMSHIPQAFSRGGDLSVLANSFFLIPFAVEGISSVVKGTYLNACAPETMARIEGKSILDLTARNNALNNF